MNNAVNELSTKLSKRLGVDENAVRDSICTDCYENNMDIGEYVQLMLDGMATIENEKECSL